MSVWHRDWDCLRKEFSLCGYEIGVVWQRKLVCVVVRLGKGMLGGGQSRFRQELCGSDVWAWYAQHSFLLFMYAWHMRFMMLNPFNVALDRENWTH